MPDSTDLVAYTESQRRGYSAACVAVRGDNRSVGLMLDENGDRILSVRSSVRCRPEHQPSYRKTACGHAWCTVCAGYVDPETRVRFSQPDPTVFCNRRPNPQADYKFLFGEVGVGTPRLTYAMATALGSRKVAKYRDITKPNWWFDLHTTHGVGSSEESG